MTQQQQKWLIRAAVILAIVAVATYAWRRFAHEEVEAGIVSGNGRIEAVEIDLAARISGRVKEILVQEGELVTAGQVLAVMDTETLTAQLRQAEAQLQQARSAVTTAGSQLAQRASEKAAARAVVAQRDVDLKNARQQLERSMSLVKQGFISSQAVDDFQARVDSAVAAVTTARAQVDAAEATITSAKSQIDGAESAASAAQANIERIQADINDTTLKAPRDGRVQYRVVQPGEIVAAGGRVLNLIDLSDVYMTFFLPTAAAGQIALNSEVRLVLDAVPGYVIPARVSFVASEAQFTPKTVETASEREKLMFRVRAQISPDLLRKHMAQVKSGLPGMAYVRLDPKVEWPTRLQANLAQ